MNRALLKSPRRSRISPFTRCFALPLSGIAAYYFGARVAGELHSGPFKGLMWVLIAGHVAAVLVHQFYWRTNVLKRMTHG